MASRRLSATSIVRRARYVGSMSNQADPRWVQTGWGHKVISVDELTRAISRIGTLQAGRRYVWRGVTDSRWRVRSSLIRALCDENDSDELGITEVCVRERERALLREARSWGFGVDSGSLVDDLHLLPRLQHHGVPTRLLDVTSNPMTALWFACQRATGTRDASGVLFAIDVTDLEQLESLQAPDGTFGSWEDSLAWPLRRVLKQSEDDSLPFLVRPSVPDPRMQAQEGPFITGSTTVEPSIPGVDGLPLPGSDAPGADRLRVLFGPEERKSGRPVRVGFCALVIPPKVKKRMLVHLETTYNRSYRVLFPDLAGMAEALRTNRLDLEEPPPESTL